MKQVHAFLPIRQSYVCYQIESMLIHSQHIFWIGDMVTWTIGQQKKCFHLQVIASQ